MLRAEGLDVEAAERAVSDAPEGARVVERFLALAEKRWATSGGAQRGDER